MRCSLCLPSSACLKVSWRKYNTTDAHMRIMIAKHCGIIVDIFSGVFKRKYCFMDGGILRGIIVASVVR